MHSSLSSLFLPPPLCLLKTIVQILRGSGDELDKSLELRARDTNDNPGSVNDLLQSRRLRSSQKQAVLPALEAVSEEHGGGDGFVHSTPGTTLSTPGTPGTPGTLGTPDTPDPGPRAASARARLEKEFEMRRHLQEVAMAGIEEERKIDPDLDAKDEDLRLLNVSANEKSSSG